MADDPGAPLDGPRLVAHVGRESARFTEALAGVDPSIPVPSCPGWTAADLVWHLAEVQMFWTAVVKDRVVDDAGIEALEAGRPSRPEGYDDLLGQSRAAAAELVEVLSNGVDGTRVWTWSPQHQTLGFVRRRQAHEALVHRVDAELTAGAPSPLDAALAADGVDEVVRVMWSGLPEWAEFVADPGTVSLEASDVGRSWRVRTGRFTGTSPRSGSTYDDPTAEVADDATEPPVARVTGPAADLDRWAWNRGGSVETSGDAVALARLGEVVRAGIQ